MKTRNTNAQHGQSKCPSCGATDISYDIEAAALVCEYCRTKLAPEPFNLVNEPIDTIEGVQIGTGAETIEANADALITLKCQSCAAEVVFNSAESTQARCHWCRNTLSLATAVPNGAVPDMVLPFAITKEEAMAELNKYVKDYRLHADWQFLREFKAENLFAVYLPYMIIDRRLHANWQGEGEIATHIHWYDDEDKVERTYEQDPNFEAKTTGTVDVDVYKIKRSYDFNINDLSIESSEEKLNHQAVDNTLNIINAIMPFDVENSVCWDANLLKGFSSEKRDVDIEQLRPLVDKQSKRLLKQETRETINYYNRGIRWDEERMDVIGERWLSVYLPVYLCSFQKTKDSKQYYFAVNARTRETMGSVPINKVAVGISSLLITLIVILGSAFFVGPFALFGLIIAPIAYSNIADKYSKLDEKHYHDSDTHTERKNEDFADTLDRKEQRVEEKRIRDENECRTWSHVVRERKQKEAERKNNKIK